MGLGSLGCAVSTEGCFSLCLDILGGVGALQCAFPSSGLAANAEVVSPKSLQLCSCEVVLQLDAGTGVAESPGAPTLAPWGMFCNIKLSSAA